LPGLYCELTHSSMWSVANQSGNIYSIVYNYCEYRRYIIIIIVITFLY